MHVVNIQEVVELRNKSDDVFLETWLYSFAMPYPQMTLLWTGDNGGLNVVLLENLEEPWTRVSHYQHGVLFVRDEINFNPSSDGGIRTARHYTDTLSQSYYIHLKKHHCEEEVWRQVDAHWNVLIGVIKGAISLMHVKNVTLEDYDPNKHISRQVRRARERKGLGPLIEYKILHIKPYGRQPKRPTAGRKTGIKQAVHTTRGHFKTFTPDRPAFGKPWGVGTFWVGPHVRGNPEFGLVMKDYHIEIDEADLIPVSQERRELCH